MNIENVFLNPPLLLVEKEQKLFNAGLNTVIVVQNPTNNYKVGDVLLVEKAYIVPLEIDGETIEGLFYVNEQFIKGYKK